MWDRMVTIAAELKALVCTTSEAAGPGWSEDVTRSITYRQHRVGCCVSWRSRQHTFNCKYPWNLTGAPTPCFFPWPPLSSHHCLSLLFVSCGGVRELRRGSVWPSIASMKHFHSQHATALQEPSTNTWYIKNSSSAPNFGGSKIRMHSLAWGCVRMHAARRFFPPEINSLGLICFEW